MLSKSIFQIRKVDPTTTDFTQISKQVSTVNFYSDTKLNLLDAQPQIAEYISSRSRFMSAAYQFARELKIKDGIDFVDDTDTKLRMREWLSLNQKASMIDGTEFGVITTKVIDSIKSINKNQYLKKLQESIKALIFTKYNPTISDFKSKENKDLLKNFVVTVDDLSKITPEEFSTLLKFELITQCKSISKALTTLQNNLHGEQQIIDKTLTKLSELEEKTSEIWLKMFDKAHKSLEKLNRRNIVESFVLSFFFEFDGSVREVEDLLLPDINLNLNNISQNTSDWLSDVIEFPENLEYVSELYKLDWSKEKSSADFGKILSIIRDEETQKKDIEKKLEPFVRDSDNWFLRHPKSAPGFPQFNDRQVYWDPKNCISLKLTENKKLFDNHRFFDYILARCLRVIQQSEVFKVYSFVSPKIADEDKNAYELLSHEWLLKLLGHNLPYLNLDEISSKTETKVLRNTKKESKKTREITRISFRYSDGNTNNRLRPIFTNKDTSTEQVIKVWIESQYMTLSRTNVELGLFYTLLQNKYITLEYIQSWLELIIKNPKLARQTANRQIELKNNNPKIVMDTSSIVTAITDKLKTIEKHLLLYQDFTDTPFQIFDKIAYNHYRNLTQIVLESLYLEPKKIRQEKSVITKLLGESVSTLPIKIDRMTATKPNGKSTLIYPINISAETVQLEKSGSILIYPVKINVVGKDVTILSNLSKALKKSKDSNCYLYCGFLNGSDDNNAVDQITYITKKDGTQGQYTRYLERKIYNEDKTVFVVDPYRPSESEDKGATNPSGYPQLYYFVVPKNHTNLIIPVDTNSYYLKKYTPYGQIGKYFELHKQLLNSELDEQNKLQLEKQILELRCKLRLNSQISSIEADLTTNQKLVLEGKNVSIQPFVTAKFHMQFQNPRKSMIPAKKNQKAEYILSIDLGEKLLACATLSKTDWENQKLDRLFSTYLPLKKLDFNSLSEKEVDPNNDKSHSTYLSAKNRYEQSQRIYGIRLDKLAHRRDHLAESYAEQISVQIAKLAYQWGAQVVFENLRPGFGNKNTIKIYNLIKIQVIKLIGEGTQNNHQNGTIAHPYKVEEISARYTSQTCSVCNYAPIFNTLEKQYISINNNWAEKGMINYEYTFNNKNVTILTIQNTSGTEISARYAFVRKNHTLETQKYVSKANGRVHFQPLYKKVQQLLFTDKTQSRTAAKLNSFHDIMKKSLLYTRLDQETFHCPSCNHQENADYQASYNIGKKWFKYKSNPE